MHKRIVVWNKPSGSSVPLLSAALDREVASHEAATRRVCPWRRSPRSHLCSHRHASPDELATETVDYKTLKHLYLI